MASEALARLQATVNRFASLAGFSPLVIDGGMGSSTENAVQNSLVWACESGALNGLAGYQLSGGYSLSALGFEPPQQVTPSRTNACNLRTRMDDTFASGGGQTFIMQNLAAIDNALSGVAAEKGLGAAALVAIKPSTPTSSLSNTQPNKSAFKVTAPPSAGFVDKTRLWFRQLPSYQQAGLGVGAGVLALFGASKYKASKKGR